MVVSAFMILCVVLVVVVDVDLSPYRLIVFFLTSCLNIYECKVQTMIMLDTCIYADKKKRYLYIHS